MRLSPLFYLLPPISVFSLYVRVSLDSSISNPHHSSHLFFFRHCHAIRPLPFASPPYRSFLISYSHSFIAMLTSPWMFYLSSLVSRLSSTSPARGSFFSPRRGSISMLLVLDSPSSSIPCFFNKLAIPIGPTESTLRLLFLRASCSNECPCLHVRTHARFNLLWWGSVPPSSLLYQ